MLNGQDRFSQAHRKRVAEALLKIRAELTIKWEATPAEMGEIASIRRDNIASLTNWRKELTQTQTHAPPHIVKEQLARIETDLQVHNAMLEVFEEEAARIDAAVDNAVTAFVDALNPTEQEALFKLSRSERAVLKTTLKLVREPSKVEELDLGGLVEDMNPFSRAAVTALAFEKSDTPFTDAISPTRSLQL